VNAYSWHPRRDRESRDHGFTLIEVIVALVLLAIVSTAVLAFFLRSMQATAHLQRNQSADAVAMEAMELLQAVDPQAVTAAGDSALVAGRTSVDAGAAWAAASIVDTADSNVVWDTVATAASHPVVPITAIVVRDSTRFTVTTLIGTCYRAGSLTGTEQACVKVDPGGAVKLFRATVVVTWKASGSGQCAGALACVYRISALIDPSSDASWNLTARPVAYDDVINLVASNSPATVQYEIVKTNDVIGSVTSNPVIVVSPPAGTSSIVTSGAQMGMLRYAPAARFSGITAMIYKLRDAAGRTSNEATVAITVQPVAVADTGVSVFRGSSTTIDVLANDLGTFTAPVASIAITKAPVVGTATSTGTTVTYNAPASGSSASFEYTVTDASGLVSNPVLVSITLTAPPSATPPPAVDFGVSIPASASTNPAPVDLGVLAATGNDATNTVVVVTGPTPVAGWSNAGALSGSGTSTVTYRPVKDTVGIYTLTYYVQSATLAKSETKTITITVAPLATIDVISVVKSSNANRRDIASNDVPPTGFKYTLDALSCEWGSDLKGASVVISSAGSLVFDAPDSRGSCVVTYTMAKTVGSGTSASTISLNSAATITVTKN